MTNDREFERCMTFTLEQECRRKKDGTLDDGYVNNPNDPGGETKYGISKRAYPSLNIRDLTLSDAISLYRKDYWYTAKNLSWPLNVCVFDCAVNQGTRTAQQYLKVVNGDYKLYIYQREQHYLSLLQGMFKDNPDREKFKKAWFQRLNNLKKYIDTVNYSQRM